MLREFGSERLIGMLHAFILLKPAINGSLREKEQALIVDARLKDNEIPLALDQSESNTMIDRLDDLYDTVNQTTFEFRKTLDFLMEKIERLQRSDISEVTEK